VHLLITFTQFLKRSHWFSILRLPQSRITLLPQSRITLSCWYHWSWCSWYTVLVGLDTSKAMGLDGIPPIVLSRCALTLYKPLHYLFKLSLQFSYLPCEWKVHKIVPVFKSGGSTHKNNYQPISLLIMLPKCWNKYSVTKLLDMLIV